MVDASYALVNTTVVQVTFQGERHDGSYQWSTLYGITNAYELISIQISICQPYISIRVSIHRFQLQVSLVCHSFYVCVIIRCNCRVASHNPFADAKHERYHCLHDVRRLTSGDSNDSFGPNRSSQSVPALGRPARAVASFQDDELTGDERRRTTETLLWENEPMSAAAAIGTSFSRRRTSNLSLGAESCVWENEPMSAAAALVPRLTLQRVSEASEGMLDGASDQGTADIAAGADIGLQQQMRAATAVSSMRSGLSGLRPHRQAPSPPIQRSSSFPNHKPEQSEEFLEYEVTSALTLKETPRSQHRHDVERELWERQAQKAAGVSATLQEGTSGSPHVSFALPASTEVRQSTGDGNAVFLLQSNTSAEVAAVIASIMPSPHVDSQLYAAATDVGHGITPTAASESILDSTGNNAGQGKDSMMSRHASVMTLYESAHSGALSESEDVATTDAVMQF